MALLQKKQANDGVWLIGVIKAVRIALLFHVVFGAVLMAAVLSSGIAAWILWPLAGVCAILFATVHTGLGVMLYHVQKQTSELEASGTSSKP